MSISDKRHANVSARHNACASSTRENLKRKEEHGLIPLSDAERAELTSLRKPPTRSRGKPAVLYPFHEQIAVDYWWGRLRPVAKGSEHLRRDSTVEADVANEWHVSTHAVRKYRKKYKQAAMGTVKVYLSCVAANPSSVSAIDANMKLWRDVFRTFVDEYKPLAPR